MDTILERVISNVDKNRQLILDAERYIWKNPEIGYKEWKTTDYLVKAFERLGYQVTRPEGITGFIADLDTGRPGPKVAILGELDSLICAEHPECDPETHAVHACGHHGQSAYLLGCAAAFAEPGALNGLCGSIRFVSVPAEETIDLEFRNQLIDKGIIRYPAGKIEFLYRGLLDGVDIALMDHLTTDIGDYLFEHQAGQCGCIVKHFEFQGKAAHAGGYPYEGINALYAATVGIVACNALREKFRETDICRFHPIVTEAGYAANAIPEVAKLDAYVRATSFHRMVELNGEVNRALAASAAAIGGNVLIQDNPGNMPTQYSEDLSTLFEDVAEEMFGKGCVYHSGWIGGSSDIGDLSSLIPCLQIHSMGVTGTFHGKDFKVVDPEKACVNAVKVLCGSVSKLLEKDAEIGRRCIRNFKPVFADKASYFRAIDKLHKSYTAVCYNEDGSITLDAR